MSPTWQRVRVGKLHARGLYDALGRAYAHHEPCVVRTREGTRAGVVVSESPLETLPPGESALGEILRPLDGNDRARLTEERDVLLPRARKAFQTLTHRRRLALRLDDVEAYLGGEKLVFYFEAQGRVDGRELVRELAGELERRVELRQVGARDAARILGDCDACGLELCCRSFLDELPPVTLAQVKNQGLRLDSATHCGACGRLKCCLRYEDQSYTELRTALPPKGSVVRTRLGVYEVVDHQVLTQLVAALPVYVEGGRRTRVVFAAEDIIEFNVAVDPARLTVRGAARAES